jgi:acyl-CoA reductase-like NAD-dependent aldehyde dehydrogenase
MTATLWHCPQCAGTNPACGLCASQTTATTYSPAQRCGRCRSELHAVCGLGDHDTADDVEIAALRAQVAQLTEERDTALRVAARAAEDERQRLAEMIRSEVCEMPHERGGMPWCEEPECNIRLELAEWLQGGGK